MSVAVAVTRKRRYQVDLAAGQAECAANYLRLARLLPGFESDRLVFGVGPYAQMNIVVTERSPYTTTLDISQSAHPLTTLAPCLGAYSAYNNIKDIRSARSMHPGGVNLTLADGSVRLVSQVINLNTWQAISSPGDGETVSEY